MTCFKEHTIVKNDPRNLQDAYEKVTEDLKAMILKVSYLLMCYNKAILVTLYLSGWIFTWLATLTQFI